MFLAPVSIFMEVRESFIEIYLAIFGCIVPGEKLLDIINHYNLSTL